MTKHVDLVATYGKANEGYLAVLDDYNESCVDESRRRTDVKAIKNLINRLKNEHDSFLHKKAVGGTLEESSPTETGGVQEEVAPGYINEYDAYLGLLASKKGATSAGAKRAREQVEVRSQNVKYIKEKLATYVGVMAVCAVVQRNSRCESSGVVR